MSDGLTIFICTAFALALAYRVYPLLVTEYKAMRIRQKEADRRLRRKIIADLFRRQAEESNRGR